MDEESATAVDFPSEQLSALRNTVAKKLPAYLARQLRSPSYDYFMLPIEDFVLLQRFMRAGFSGALGNDFPVRELIRLERETRKFVPSQPTLRWEPRDGYEEIFTAALEQTDPKALQVFQHWKEDQDARRKSGQPTCDPVSK